MHRARARFAIVVAAGALALVAIGRVDAQDLAPIPPLSARVTDTTGTLSAGERAALEAKLAAFEAEKGAQVAVLLVPTTAPEDIAQYGIRVADAWKVGRAGPDDGALLIVAKEDRALRIEVGYGLEGVLTDATSRRIIDETIVPRFREDDYYGGLDAGADRLLAVIRGEALPPPSAARRLPSGAEALLEMLPLLFGVVMIASALLRRAFGRGVGSLVTGGITGGVTYLLLTALGVSIAAGVAAWLLSLLMSVTGAGRWANGTGRGGWGGGSWGGGGWGGSGGGGGWSGGGGGFGGGGASGRW